MLTFRPATSADAPLLLAWRNDPETRANSRRQHPLTWDELIEAPAGTRRDTQVAEIDGVPVGTVRLDWSGDECELSWTVAPACRKRGIGTLMVAEAVRALPTVKAEIKPDNLASQKIAIAAGLEMTGCRDGLEVWRKP